MSLAMSTPSVQLASELVSKLLSTSQKALLDRDMTSAGWCLDTALLIDPSLAPRLWQRGLYLYYSSCYREGMMQFENDMDTNGGDVEEVLWHFICKASLIGFVNAQKDGFLMLCNTDNHTPPIPMLQVLALYKGHGSIEDILSISTHTKPGHIVPSYNGVNALGYAHFYIGIYYQLREDKVNAYNHLKKAVAVGNEDFIGRLMEVHLEHFLETLKRDHIREAIIYGGWQLSSGHNLMEKMGTSTYDIVCKLLETIDQGVTVFDCGDIYTGVEQLYGLMLEAHIIRGGKRSDIQLNSKLVPDLDIIKRGGVDEDYVRGIVRRSLNRLRTTYIDLIQFHWWVWSCPGYVGVVKTLAELQKEGVVRKIGLTNCDVEHTKEILIEGNVQIATTQVQLSLLDHRPIDSGLVSYCTDHNINILAYGVLAGGFLTDKWRGQPEPSLATQLPNRSLVKYQLILKEFGSWELFQRLLSVLHSIALSHSPLTLPNEGTCTVTIAMVAIAYVLRIKCVGSVILGSINISHLQESLLAVHLSLTEQDIQNIETVIKKRCGPKGVVFGLERDTNGPHGSIMKFNLNQLNGPVHLEEICSRFLELYFSAYPVEGTCAGYRYQTNEVTLANPHTLNHTPLVSTAYSEWTTRALSYDYKLNIASKEDILNYVEKVKNLLEETHHISDSHLSIDQKVDRELIISQLNLELVKWLEVRFHERDPAYYLPFDALNYLLPSWHPEDSKEDSNVSGGMYHPGVSSLSIKLCLASLLSRLRQIPGILQTGLQNLVRPVKLLTERAISLCDNLLMFLSADLPQLVKQMLTDCEGLMTEVIQASIVVSYCVQSYKVQLEATVLPNSSNEHLSVGQIVYDKLLQYGHFLDDSAELLKLGERHFSLVKTQLVKLAESIDPHKTWAEITNDTIRPSHPTAKNLLLSYMAEINRAKEHVIEKDLVPKLPEGEHVLGFYTPQFLVPFSPFGDFLNPSPFAQVTDTTTNTNDLRGYLMLHSIAAKCLSPQEEETLLQSHDYTWISVIAPHECYPGHHVQALLAQSHPRILRKFYKSPYFYEGWGLYCEQLAYETGFFRKTNPESSGVLSDPDQYEKLTHMTQLRLQLWRAARVILDIKLHRNEMCFEECCEFLCREVMFDGHSVNNEVFMYVSCPTYAPCYVAGYRELLKLRDKEKHLLEKKRVFSLKEFHRKVLATGCIPFPLIEKILNGTK